jgi:hypothetical protein
MFCDKACKGISLMCRGCGRGIGQCCDAVAEFVAPVTRSPLGGYVVGTWLVMVLAIASCGYALSEVHCKQARSLFLANIGISLVHMSAARYLQWRIVGSFHREGKDMQALAHHEIAQRATHVALYDIGFCLYVFFFLGAFSLDCWALTTFKSCGHDGPAWAATAIEILYSIFVWNYFFFWYCCQSCRGKKEQQKEIAASKKATVPAQKEGDNQAPPQQDIAQGVPLDV